jgi:hypothetical protein
MHLQAKNKYSTVKLLAQKKYPNYQKGAAVSLSRQDEEVYESIAASTVVLTQLNHKTD